MAFRCVEGDDRAWEFPVGSGSGINEGELSVYDRSNAVAIPGTSALLAEDIAFVAAEDAPSGAGVVRGVPIRTGQLWEWDTTNNTAADQLCKRSLLTNASTVNNTSTDQAVDEITVTPIINVGAAGDKKQRGFITVVPGTLS